LRHGHGFFLAGNDRAIMALFTGATSNVYVHRMAEYNGTETFYRIGDVTRLATVATGAIFFAGDAESLYAAVARTAGSGLFHLCHSIAFLVSQIEDCIMAYPAVIMVFLQVELVTEYNRLRIFESEEYIFGFGCTGADDGQHAYCNGQH
jgi:hypothetical protein